MENTHSIKTEFKQFLKIYFAYCYAFEKIHFHYDIKESLLGFGKFTSIASSIDFCGDWDDFFLELRERISRAANVMTEDEKGEYGGGSGSLITYARQLESHVKKHQQWSIQEHMKFFKNETEYLDVRFAAQQAEIDAISDEIHFSNNRPHILRIAVFLVLACVCFALAYFSLN